MEVGVWPRRITSVDEHRIRPVLLLIERIGASDHDGEVEEIIGLVEFETSDDGTRRPGWNAICMPEGESKATAVDETRYGFRKVLLKPGERKLPRDSAEAALAALLAFAKQRAEVSTVEAAQKAATPLMAAMKTLVDAHCRRFPSQKR